MNDWKPPPTSLHALVRLLTVIEEFTRLHGRGPYTRELLSQLRSWGYGEGCFPWLGVWDLLRGMMIIVMGVVGGFVGLIGLVNAAVSS